MYERERYPQYIDRVRKDRLARRRRNRDDRRGRRACGALAIGPGLGRGDARRVIVRELLERVDLPAVVDADGLFGLEPVRRATPTVPTPHAGELTRLLGTDSAWVGAHRLVAARQGAKRFGAIVLLKGQDKIVYAPGEEAIVCDLGHLPWLGPLPDLGRARALFTWLARRRDDAAGGRRDRAAAARHART